MAVIGARSDLSATTIAAALRKDCFVPRSDCAERGTTSNRNYHYH